MSNGVVKACLRADSSAIGYLACIALVFFLILASCLPTYLLCLDLSITFRTLAQICAEHKIPYVKRTLINIIIPLKYICIMLPLAVKCIETFCDSRRNQHMRTLIETGKLWQDSMPNFSDFGCVSTISA